MPSPHDEERLRQAAALWFARRRGPNAAAHQADFDAWIGDIDHRHAYERLEQRWSESAILGQAARARPALSGLRRRTQPRFGGFMPGALAGLAVCALVMAALAWQGPNLGPGLASLDPLARRLSTEVGEIRTVRLDDGASLTLDTDSAALIRIASGERHVRLLKGRGRFSLKARSDQPLIVDADAIRVRGARSTFDVDMTGAHRIGIALLDGEVTVGPAPWAPPAPGGDPPRVGLAPGQIVSLAGDRRVLRTDTMSALSRGWPSGWLSLDNTPLAEVIAAANRYSRRKIEVGDDRFNALRVTGAFKAAAPERLADALAAAFHLKVAETPDGVLKLTHPDI